MIILASKSPRRRELLAQIGVNFICKVSDIDETPESEETPIALVKRLATAKAQAVYSKTDKGDIVLGSDTIVTIDKKILGKPINRQDGINTLKLLSGKTHQVITAVTLLSQVISKTIVVENSVTFTTLSENEIIKYWQTGEPIDKAGSYAIQGLAAQYISHLSGSYSAVMGLPLFETAQLLKQAGVSLSGDEG